VFVTGDGTGEPAGWSVMTNTGSDSAPATNPGYLASIDALSAINWSRSALVTVTTGRRGLIAVISGFSTLWAGAGAAFAEGLNAGMGEKIGVPPTGTWLPILPRQF